MSGLLKNFFQAKSKPAAHAPQPAAVAAPAVAAPNNQYSSLNAGLASVLVGGQAAQKKDVIQDAPKDLSYGTVDYFQRLFKLTDIIDRSKVSLRYV